MGGWNIFYGLINFAILAVGLYFVGRKIVFNGIRAHQDKVSGALRQSAASHENAKTLLDGIEGENARGAEEREGILAAARQSAGDIRRAAEASDRKDAERIAQEAHKDFRRLVHQQRLQMNAEAAEEITSAAARQRSYAGSR